MAAAFREMTGERLEGDAGWQARTPPQCLDKGSDVAFVGHRWSLERSRLVGALLAMCVGGQSAAPAGLRLLSGPAPHGRTVFLGQTSPSSLSASVRAARRGSPHGLPVTRPSALLFLRDLELYPAGLLEINETRVVSNRATAAVLPRPWMS
jgi:hypothetical protein